MEENGRMPSGFTIGSALVLITACLMQHPVAQGAIGQPVVGKSAVAGLANSAWPRYRGNAHNTGRSRRNALPKAAPWTIETIGKNVCASPAVGDDGTVFIGADDLYAVDGATGKKR